MSRPGPWRKRPSGRAAVAGLAAALALAPATPPLCPQDKTPMTATGKTRQEGGKTLAEYKCERGHLYWVAVD